MPAALTDPTLMRVRSAYEGLGSGTGCDGYSQSGETWDFTINIAEADPVPFPCVPFNFIGAHTEHAITRVQVLGSGLDRTSTTIAENAFGNAYTVVPATGRNSATGTLIRDTLYNLIVSGQYGNTDLGVWIDWDHDLEFDATELVGFTGGSPLNTTFRVPINAQTGATLLRVRSSYQGLSAGAGCNGYITSGETWDITITINGQPGCNTGQFAYAISSALCSGANATVSPSFSPGASAVKFRADYPGLNLDSITGVINLAQSRPGIYAFTNYVQAVGACPANTFIRRYLRVDSIPPQPTITASGSVPLVLTSSSPSGNQWYANGTIRTGSTTSSISLNSSSQNGTYTVVVSNNGCLSQPSAGYVVTLTGLQPVSKKDVLQLYPNPAQYKLTVVSPDAGAYAILNTLGQKVLAGKTDAGAHDSDISELHAGLYTFAYGKEKRLFVKE